MEFIDTHCHYNDEAFDQDREEVISKALQAGVVTMLQADVDSGERDSMFALVDSHPGVLRPMLGLYPGSVDKGWERELSALEPWLERKDIVAIGEIGLDYHYGAEFKEEQKAALREQFELAARLGLPVNIHLREATGDFMEVLESCRHLGLRGNMHAFSGSWETFCRLQSFGEWYIGIGGVLTFKKSTLPEVVARVPLERMVLETDAPYLTPTPFRGTRNDSSYIPLIAAKVAEIKGLDIEEVAATTTANARKLFGL